MTGSERITTFAPKGQPQTSSETPQTSPEGAQQACEVPGRGKTPAKSALFRRQGIELDEG
jgi:hypothetical protein